MKPYFTSADFGTGNNMEKESAALYANMKAKPLLDKLERYEKALKNYSDDSNWQDLGEFVMINGIERMRWVNGSANDRGKTARAALEWK